MSSQRKREEKRRKKKGKKKRVDGDRPGKPRRVVLGFSSGEKLSFVVPEMPGARFDHELRFRRALYYLKELDRQVGVWRDGRHYTVRHEYDPDGQMLDLGPAPPNAISEMLLTVTPIHPHSALNVPLGHGLVNLFATAEKPPNNVLAVLIGECLHNLRSGLDNLAFTLAHTFTTHLPDEIAENSEFPIFGDRNGEGSARFHRIITKGARTGDPVRSSGLAKIAGWDPLAQAVVEQLQPYRRGTHYRSDPLWILHVLDQINKNHLVHAAPAFFELSLTQLIPGLFNVRQIGPGVIQSLPGPIESDTPIARICGIHRVDPTLQIGVKVDAAVDLAFSGDSPAAAGERVVNTLADIYGHIVGAVLPALAPYL